MNALEIARVNIVRTFRDRTSLFFILVLPMILIVVLGMTYGGMNAARVGVVDQDGGPLAVDLATAMSQTRACSSTSGRSTRAPGAPGRRSSAGSSSSGSSSTRATTPRSAAAGTAQIVEYVSLPTELLQPVRHRRWTRRSPTRRRPIARRPRCGEPRRASRSTRRSRSPAARQRPTSRGWPSRSRPSGTSTENRERLRGRRPEPGHPVHVPDLDDRRGRPHHHPPVRDLPPRVLRRRRASRTIVLGETLGRFAFALIQGLFIVVRSAVLFGGRLGRPAGDRCHHRAVRPRRRPGAAMVLATLVSNEHQLSALGPALGMLLGAARRRDGPDRGLPARSCRRSRTLTPHAWAIDAFHRLPARRRRRRRHRAAAAASCWASPSGCWPSPRSVSAVRSPAARSTVYARSPSGRAMNVEDLRPRRRARIGELGRLAVEEAVRRARVGDEPVVDAGRRAAPRRRPRSTSAGMPVVGAAEQAEDAAVHRDPATSTGAGVSLGVRAAPAGRRSRSRRPARDRASAVTNARRPPKQKPIVNSDRTGRPPSALGGRPRPRGCPPSGRPTSSAATCGMYSKSSSRGSSVPAVRPK